MKNLLMTSLIIASLILLTGCAQPGVDLVEELALVESTAEVVVVDPFDIYRKSLIEDFQNDLDDLVYAPQYTLDIQIEDQINKVKGFMEVTYTNQTRSELQEIYFRLIPNSGGNYLAIQDIHVDGVVAEGEFLQQNTLLRIALNAPLLAGENITISMNFSLQVPTEMGGNYGLFIYQEEILALDAFFPIIPAIQKNTWQADELTSNADAIFTDAAFFSVRVSAPKDLILVTSGVEIESHQENDHQVRTFVGGPQRDFYIAASSRFSVASMQVGGTIINSYFPEEYRSIGEKILLNTTQALIFFSERYGHYPYTELDLVSTPMRAGGMEYSGVAALALHLYQSDELISGEPGMVFMESATAHEIAHQWFFNQVMNDPQKEPWLDEGLAQYLTYIYYLDSYGQNAANLFVDSWYGRWRRVDEEQIPIGKPAGDYNDVEYSAIIYGRAPLFMLELEGKMGLENFQKFLREYVDRYRWKIVDAEIFKNLAEEICVCDLTELFNDWVWQLPEE